MPWIDVEQNTDEWLDLRIGKIGGSSIGKIMANYGKAFGKPAHDQALRVALEKITGQRHENTYSNAHMERGHEQEPIARMLYEERTFSKVMNGGFFDFDEYIGVSPDGLVGTDGSIEIKSVIDTVHYETIKRGAFDPSYKWQLYLNLKSLNRAWIDYVQYCAAFPVGKQLFVQRIFYADCEIFFHMIDSRLDEFKGLVEEKTEMINKIA